MLQYYYRFEYILNLYIIFITIVIQEQQIHKTGVHTWFWCEHNAYVKIRVEKKNAWGPACSENHFGTKKKVWSYNFTSHFHLHKIRVTHCFLFYLFFIFYFMIHALGQQVLSFLSQMKEFPVELIYMIFFRKFYTVLSNNVDIK